MLITLGVIEKIKIGELTADEAVAHFQRVVRDHRETGAYDPKLVDARVRNAESGEPPEVKSDI